MSLFRRNHSKMEQGLVPARTMVSEGVASYVLPFDAQLEQLAEEERRWEGLIQGTTHDTDVILNGIRDVHARRAALLESNDQVSGQ